MDQTKKPILAGWAFCGDGGSRKLLILKEINTINFKSIPKNIPKTTNSPQFCI
jgi:hypothetical protein